MNFILCCVSFFLLDVSFVFLLTFAFGFAADFLTCMLPNMSTCLKLLSAAAADPFVPLCLAIFLGEGGLVAMVVSESFLLSGLVTLSGLMLARAGRAVAVVRLVPWENRE